MCIYTLENFKLKSLKQVLESSRFETILIKKLTNKPSRMIKKSPYYLILVLLFLVFTSSCKKTYECRDRYDLAIGQVNARNLKEAEELCPMGSAAVLIKE